MMLKLWGDRIAWMPHADNEMTFSTMLDFFRSIKLSETIGVGLVSYSRLYKDHTDLVIDIVGIFFHPNGLFIPSQISEEKTNEFYLFEVLSKIISLTQYYELEDDRGEKYRIKRQEYEKALCLVKKYSDVEISFNGFPKHKNEILEDLREFFENIKRPTQGKKVIELVKSHFDIRSVNKTKRLKRKKKREEELKDYIQEQEKKGFSYKTEINADGTSRTYLDWDKFPNFKY